VKQRITIDDLNQLTKEQREKLRKWWKPRVGDWAAVCGNKYGVLVALVQKFTVSKRAGLLLRQSKDVILDVMGYKYDKKDCLPLLSIGQMIEILDSYYQNKGFNFEIGYTIVNKRWGIWNDCILEHEQTELCDALWEAVKSIL
jgi:hypothetical protein